MMQLTDLPEEIIIIILRKLDFWSLQSMYNTCTHVRNIICSRSVIQECHMSLNTMATVNTLKLKIFKDISNHLMKLNMRGVPDLHITKVLTAFKKLKSLKTLDISYTNLHIVDLVKIHKICPTLKDITVNFMFGPPGIFKMSKKKLLECQSVFEHFENVHFVGSLTTLFSDLALDLLKNSRLNVLKLSAVQEENVHTTIVDHGTNCQIPQFGFFTAYLVNWKITNMYQCLSKFPILSRIEFKNYEFVIMSQGDMKTVSVYATEIFKKFFSENFDTTVEVMDYNSHLVGNVALMLWNKKTTKFDDSFFHKLYRHVKQYYVIFYNSPNQLPALQKYDWFYIEPEPIDLTHDEDIVFVPKRGRNVMQSLLIDYEHEFSEKKEIQLSVFFNCQVTISVKLSPTSGFLKILTYISLCGTCYYSAQFFSILFRHCDNLVTLSIESPAISPCAAPIQRYISLSRSLKNIRLIDKCMNYEKLFAAFSQCRTLQNIHLIDHRSWDQSQIADPGVLVEQCANLYCVFIEAPFGESGKVKLLQLFKKAQIRCNNHYLKVVINKETFKSMPFRYYYDPFLDVFKLNSIKPI